MKNLFERKTITMAIPGIQTSYKKRMFRSRLEARWASLFDLFEWKYEYEPFDLNGWIPDFILFGHLERTLVEVKPFSSETEFRQTLSRIIKAIADTCYQHTEFLLLGCTIFEKSTSFNDFPTIGWLFDGNSLDEAILNYHDNKYGFFHASGSWYDRITGEYDGDHLLTAPSQEEVFALWSSAGNSTQWKGG